MKLCGIVSAGLVVSLLGCGTAEPGRNAAYFESPQQAVAAITRMLKEEDFNSLAAYYDLAGTDVKRSDLESGEFFIRRKRPESAHPAGFWRYKHPFAPGFEYSSHRAAGEAGVHVIEVSITIDQGAGSPPQRGFDRFRMRKSEKGWQVLPQKPK